MAIAMGGVPLSTRLTPEVRKGVTFFRGTWRPASRKAAQAPVGVSEKVCTRTLASRSKTTTVNGAARLKGCGRAVGTNAESRSYKACTIRRAVKVVA